MNEKKTYCQKVMLGLLALSNHIKKGNGAGINDSIPTIISIATEADKEIAALKANKLSPATINNLSRMIRFEFDELDDKDINYHFYANECITASKELNLNDLANEMQKDLNI